MAAQPGGEVSIPVESELMERPQISRDKEGESLLWGGGGARAVGTVSTIK